MPQIKEPVYESVPISQIAVGDVINVNTGYTIMDDEDCEVLEIEAGMSLFENETVNFYIKSRHGNHHYDVLKYQSYERETQILKRV